MESDGYTEKLLNALSFRTPLRINLNSIEVKKVVVSILKLDLARAFNNILYKRLL